MELNFPNDLKSLELKASDFIRSHYFADLLVKVPLILMVLDSERKVVYANKSFEQHMYYAVKSINYAEKRPGDCIGCIHAASSELGCGTTEHCKYCGLAATIQKTELEGKANGECQIEMINGDALVFKVHGHGFNYHERKYTFIAFEDISDQKARRLLEKIFLHDLNNTLSILYNLPEIFESFETEMIKKILKEVSVRMHDEITTYQVISAAENQQLQICPESVDLVLLVNQIINGLKYSTKFCNISAFVDVNPISIVTDKTILRQVLYNMVKNAMEAGEEDDSINVSSKIDFGNKLLMISVGNKQVMPIEARMQIFKKSFSTKGTDRGWGTYSIKLLTEKYLKGKASFISEEGKGTIFTITLPMV